MDISEIRLINMLELIKEKGTQAKLAEAVDMTSGEISHIKSKTHKRQVGNSLARKFEVAMNKPRGWMDQLHTSGVNELPSEYIGHVDAWDSNTPLHEDEVTVPFFMEVELAAGNGSDMDQEYHGPKLRFSKSTLRGANVQPENAACVKVSGNSMEPRLFDGDVVGVNLGSKKVVDGSVYAIKHDDMLKIKRLYKPGRDTIRVNSFNQEEHPDIISHEGSDGVTIIGKVFWSSSMWK